MDTGRTAEVNSARLVTRSIAWSIACIKGNERIDEIPSPPSECGLTEELGISRVAGKGRLVRPLAGQSIEHVHDPDDLREQWDIITSKSIGISCPVETLVMMAHDRSHVPKRPERSAQLLANHRMTFHAVVFRSR